jgi:hypothetical protein
METSQLGATHVCFNDEDLLRAGTKLEPDSRVRVLEFLKEARHQLHAYARLGANFSVGTNWAQPNFG